MFGDVQQIGRWSRPTYFKKENFLDVSDNFIIQYPNSNFLEDALIFLVKSSSLKSDLSVINLFLILFYENSCVYSAYILEFHCMKSCTYTRFFTELSNFK